MPKRTKKGVARVAKGYILKKVAKAKDNPTVKAAQGDALTVLLPAAGAFAAGMLLSAGVNRAARPKLGEVPKGAMAVMAPHLAPVVSIIALVVAWFATRHIKSLKKYSTGILAGVGISTVLTLINTYIVNKGQLLAVNPFAMPVKPPVVPIQASQSVALQLPSPAPQAPPEESSYSDDGAGATVTDLDEYKTGIFADGE